MEERARTYSCNTTTFILNKTKKKKGWPGRCEGPETETQYRAQRNEEELNFAVGGINDPALSDRKTYRAPWTSASIRWILNSACTVPFKSMNSKYLKMFSPFILRLLHSTSRERSYLESRYYDDINTKDVYLCEGILLLFLLELEARIGNLVPWLDNVLYSLLRIQRSNLKTGYCDKACVHYFHNTVRLVPSFWKCFVIYFINPRCCCIDR